MFEDFVTYMSQFHNVEHLGKDMEKYLTRVSYPPKHVVVEKGTVCNYVFFLEKGMMRAYYKKTDNSEVTTWVLHEKQFVTAIQSFNSREPSLETVETLEPTTLVMVHYDDMMKFCYIFHDFALCMFKLYQHLNVMRYMRNYLVQALKAPDRYDALCKSDPDLVRRVPLRVIASYLDITQETLSRIRKQRMLEGVCLPNVDDSDSEDEESSKK
jgi:CRP-like cAMP-binding protein